ncbi:hypothetical protein EZ428_17440 [Pedobacter frigiditerrae]|uniref:Uncharacterized protein n=1 Tax=Pedobacter frigiditerrae TaxID=2530452 RepID=A0A4R0MRE6_9SPHI|nr:hypothetical protein [Pedobacter frigiditerrae]TCC89475.1 hypothetical protein EZ428_17440 [Pedobacter frigiditerrae]
MKNIFLFGILFLLANFSFGQKLDKKQWINFYKEYATYRCLCEVTDNKVEQYLSTKKDVSFSVHSEFLGTYIEKADSIGRDFAKNMRPIQVDKENDLFGMNTNFKNCLLFYKSKSLDSIAKKSYQGFSKGR